jgi:predicted phosphodiesterase
MRVAHLTDLHFRHDTPDELPNLVLGVLEQEGLDLVICTGDIVTRDTVENMDLAFRKAAEFRKATGLKWLSVPGNHDLYDKDYTYLPGMYQEHWEPETWFRHEREGILFAGINSGHQDSTDDPVPAQAKRYLELVKYGDVSVAQIQALTEALAGHSGPSVVCLHHHILPLWNHIFQSYYNADMVFSAALLLDTIKKQDVAIVLSGHKHAMSMNVLNGTIIVNGGSLFAPLPGEQENSFNILELDHQGRIEIEQVMVPSGQRVHLC